MKKLFVLSLMFLGFSALTFAQDMNQVKFNVSGAQLKEALNKGDVSFFFNKAADADAIKKSAEFYPQYFAVNYDKASGKCNLKLTKDDMSKLVVSRFLMSNGISEVLIDNKAISVQDFMAEYLR